VTKEISYEDLKALVGKSQNLFLVDVRTKEEVDKGRIPGSVHIPVDTVEAAFKMEPEDFKAKYGVTKPPLDAPELVFHCQVLRLVMLLGKQRQQRAVKTAGGLLVLLWTTTGEAVQSLNCTVLTDLKESMFPRMSPCPSLPDPEELCAFTDLYGSLRLLLSFQMRDSRLFLPEWCARIEAFLHMFSLVNAGV
ncbi:Thiosulfate sulfurtransferase/rhodanese-like domain-containing protein 1, partial [Nibea albiflora]